MRLSSILPVTAALVLGALASLATATIAAHVVEDKSEAAVSLALEAEGLSWTQVETDGLRVILGGTAPNDIEQLAAQRTASRVVDPARVINAMNLAKTEIIPPPRFSIEILRNDQGISLIGLVPQAWDRNAAIDAIRTAAGTGNVTDLLESADHPMPDGWSGAMDFGVAAIKLLPRSKMSLAADEITVTALADSREAKRRLERELERMVPDGIETNIDVAAPRPVITPFTARFIVDENGPSFDACAAETPQGQARIIAAARAAGVQEPECVIGLGSPSTAWAAAVEAGIRAVTEIGQGSVTFSDGNVSFLGTEYSDRDAFDSAAGELERALPASFSLHSDLPDPVKVDGTGDGEGTPEFIVIRSPEGQIQLRGRIADERTKSSTEAFARALFGSDAVYGATRIDADLPQGWSLRALAAIEALSWLANGSAIVQPDFARIHGETGDPNARAEIATLLSDKLGDAANFDIEVTYVRKLDPVLNLPTPAECVVRANQIMNSDKIIFAPGSAELDEAANNTLDRIAKALEDCEDVRMEIGGHTDSQGREIMNQQLSQTRADAVLDAMLARRVVGVSFTANGYGEVEPIDDNGTEDGREANRRIEFKLIDANGNPVSTDGTEPDPALEEGSAQTTDQDQETDAAE